VKKIKPASTQFLLGLGNPDQAEKWLEKNSATKGVCFIGRSNVGKSSLINSMFGANTARISKKPGKTREINIFDFSIVEEKDVLTERFLLFDLPGYGYAKVSKEMTKQWQQLMDTFFTHCPGNFLMISLQDCRHPNQKSDQLFSDYFKTFNLPYGNAFNKFDKLKNQKERSLFNKFLKQFKSEHGKSLFNFKVSAEKKTGLNELESFIADYLTR